VVVVLAIHSATGGLVLGARACFGKVAKQPTYLDVFRLLVYNVQDLAGYYFGAYPLPFTV
jgi:hypothetical protein